MIDWEHTWAPYSAADYAFVMAHVLPNDTIVDIGAGDLRLAIQMAGVATHVTAIEMNLQILQQGCRQWAPLPPNLEVVCADALSAQFPMQITLAVLLMRHCTHFAELTARLQAAGCQRLLTNARWGMGVEAVDLTKPPQPYSEIEMGWYACRCGATGFKAGSADIWTAEKDAIIYEVCGCPACKKPDETGS